MPEHADQTDINIGDIAGVVDNVLPDEKVYFLSERNLRTRDYKHLRRWQIVGVNRNGNMAFWTRDLGPAVQFRTPEVRIVSLWEHSFAEVLDMAERQRTYDDSIQEFMRNAKGESTLIKDFLEQLERDKKVLRRQSVFGPKVRSQRNG